MATATKTRSARKPYDPGQPGEVTRIGRNHYRVESFREAGHFYSVDLGPTVASCTCEHYQCRIAPQLEQGEGAQECKHATAARGESRRLMSERARSLPAAELRRHWNRADLSPEVKDLIDEVLFDRLHMLIADVERQVRSRSYLRV